MSSIMPHLPALLRLVVSILYTYLYAFKNKKEMRLSRYTYFGQKISHYYVTQREIMERKNRAKMHTYLYL